MAKNHNGIPPFAGFMYQWNYFLKCLICIPKGETISFEKLDDVGCESGDEITLYQLKHTVKSVQNDNDSQLVNLTDKDIDLWKALYVWVDIIEKEGSEDAQSKYIDNATFIFVSNKNDTKNKMISKIKALKNSEISIDNIKQYLDNILFDWKPKNIQGENKSFKYYCYSLHRYVLLEKFLKKVEFVKFMDEECKDDIKYNLHNYKAINNDKLDEAYERYIGAVWNKCGDKILKGQIVSYTAEEFTKDYINMFTQFKGNEFKYKRNFNHCNGNPLEETMIKQLIDIGDITENDSADIMRYLSQCYDYIGNMDELVKESFADESDIQQIEDDAFFTWKNKFKKIYNRIDCKSPDKTNNLAIELLDEIRDIVLPNSGAITLETYFSNGCFYKLSNEPRIGWRNDWENNYKNG